MSISGLSQVTDGLFLSSAAAARKTALLIGHRITCVINVSLECSVCLVPGVQYLHFSVADLPETPLYNYVETILQKIHEEAAAGGRTLIHCVAGISRAPTFCLLYLMRHHGLTLLAAHEHLRSRRPIIHPNIGFWRQLIDYERHLFGTNTVQIIESPMGPIPSIYEAVTNGMVPF